MDDHDLLVSLNTKMESVYNTIQRLEGVVVKQKDYCETRGEHCNIIHDSKVDNGWFKWVIGIIVVILISSAGMSVDTKLELEKVKQDLNHQQIEFQLEAP